MRASFCVCSIFPGAAAATPASLYNSFITLLLLRCRSGELQQKLLGGELDALPINPKWTASSAGSATSDELVGTPRTNPIEIFPWQATIPQDQCFLLFAVLLAFYIEFSRAAAGPLERPFNQKGF
jgi:hypothetical protein